MKTTQKALSILLAVLLVFTCISTAWAAEVSSQLESAVESSVESTPPEESNPSSEPESGPESETPEPSVTPEATPSQEPTTAPAPVSDPYVEHFEIIDAEFGGEYVMVAPEAEDITQEFSRSHQALDIAAPAGSPVLAADEGTVTTVQVWDGSKSTEGSQSYGHMVQVKHPDGNSTLYAHLSEINVKQGQTVQRGQQIGRVGSTGNADGAHLHFEVLTSKGKVDPYPYLTGIELYARDPISKVESDLGGGSHYLTGYGVTRQAIVDELSAHEHDSYYLGTRYAGGDVQSPKIDGPEIGTKASFDGAKEIDPLGEATLTDVVSYSGLTVGKAYTVKGVLMDKATGEPLLIEDQQITAEAQFVPEEAEGTVEVPFVFDASALRGKDVVVFEILYRDGLEVAAHADIDDEGQTVRIHNPEIGTKATVDGEKQAEPLKEITLVDEVAYSGLMPGRSYTIKGVLMDKSTGEKLLVDGKEVTATTEFTPDEASGTVNVPFTFDASGLQGKTVVVFETLYHRDIELAVHADIEDADQTVSFGAPELKTTATIGGKKEAAPAKELVLEDVVAYKGLTPGKEYTVKGVLMDKSTGKKFLVGDKEITTEATFTPEKPDGEVKVTFKFDGSAIKRKTELVVFETLYLGKAEIAAHADLEDKGQTVTIAPPPGDTDIPKTGDTRNILLPMLTLGAAVAGLVVLGLVRRRRKEFSQTGLENGKKS